jgi:hypothetical protein
VLLNKVRNSSSTVPVEISMEEFGHFLVQPDQRLNHLQWPVADAAGTVFRLDVNIGPRRRELHHAGAV